MWMIPSKIQFVLINLNNFYDIINLVCITIIDYYA